MAKRRCIMANESWSMFASRMALLKTFCLLAVIFLHAVFPFTKTGEFWRFYAARQSGAAEFLIFVEYRREDNKNILTLKKGAL
jgi:hypothetical protein